MSEKLKSAIEKISLNATAIGGEEYAATFRDAEIEPSYVNFFYGSNGTGKSTIATAIDFIHGENGKGKPAALAGSDGRLGLTWQMGKTELDYDLLVYNQKFVEDNFSNYGNVLGIFTMGGKNVEIQREVNEKKNRESDIRREITTNITAKGEAETESNGLFATYQDSLCKAGNTVRRAFPDALKGKVGRNEVFAKYAFDLTAMPFEHEIEALTALYAVAYNANAQKYSEFRKADLSHLKAKTECVLLMRAIVSTSNSTLAEAIKKLGSGGFDWIIKGHEQYEPNAEGKCPYCNKTLDKHFSEQLQACFDKQYQEEIAAIKNFRAEYERYARSLIEGFNANLLQTVYPKLETSGLPGYRDKIDALETTLKLNIQLIDGKIKEPSLPMSEELTDIEPLCLELNALIDGFNRQIGENNAIFADMKNKKDECEKHILERLAFDVKEIKEQYKTALAAIKAKIAGLDAQIKADSQAADALDRECSELRKDIVNIENSVESINLLLRDSGFEGFQLRTHPDSGQNAYQVIRSRTGKPAKKLSEGERNFIAFLYFYHLVNKGSHSDTDTGKDRVVVIDDPVSSMDSSVLFVVSALVREMIEVCYNNVDYADGEHDRQDFIKQLFVLTHNMYFHSAITHEQVERYEGVSFFLVNKTNENSTVKLCVENTGAVSKVNENPVKSAYVALWSEYKDLLKERTDNSTSYRATLMNNSNQILEHYFIQLCGYSRDFVRKAIRDKRNDVLGGVADSAKRPQYLLALSMLDSITADSRHEPDSAYFSGGEVDPEQYREAFKLIFDAMKHEQHYEKMMK